MRAVDESLWRQQLTELAEDGDTGRRFAEILVAWIDEAEQILEADTENRREVADVVRDTLAVVESRFGRLGLAFISQMLVLMITHWAFGERLVDGLTAVELRLVQETLVHKVAELMTDAAKDLQIEEGESDDEHGQPAGG